MELIRFFLFSVFSTAIIAAIIGETALYFIRKKDQKNQQKNSQTTLIRGMRETNFY